MLILDADRQGTAANWAGERGERTDLPQVHCVQRYGNLFRPIQDLAKRYGDIIVDAGGRDSEELRTAMVAADKLYSPVRASQSDLWTVERMDEVAGLAKGLNQTLEAYTVLSMAQTNPRITEAPDAADMLGEFEHLKPAKAVIRDRKAFRDAMCEGCGVMELRDAKATQELVAFSKEVLGGEIQTHAAN